MNAFVETLLNAQRTLLRHTPLTTEHRRLVEQLRKSVPAPVLAHFLRLVERGEAGVALVRHGVCSACHIRVASGTVAMLAAPHDLHLCETCGCYLLLPDDEIPSFVRARPIAVAVKRGRKPRALAV